MFLRKKAVRKYCNNLHLTIEFLTRLPEQGRREQLHSCSVLLFIRPCFMQKIYTFIMQCIMFSETVTKNALVKVLLSLLETMTTCTVISIAILRAWKCTYMKRTGRKYLFLLLELDEAQSSSTSAAASSAAIVFTHFCYGMHTIKVVSSCTIAYISQKYLLSTNIVSHDSLLHATSQFDASFLV